MSAVVHAPIGAESERSQGDALLHNVADYRQIGIVTSYWALLAAMMFIPACRNVVFFVAACALSFLNAVVIHNHVHKGIFRSRTLNRWFRAILSFSVLYPASTNLPSHNLVHHHFDDDGQPDWAAPDHAQFRWNLLNLIHFPNIAGPNTFVGTTRWARTTRQPEFREQHRFELFFAFGLTGALLLYDFWTALFFVVMPQLWGARGILRINLLQHDACAIDTEWNHSRNFVGRAFNWVMCNNGYHTIHHNRAGLHWSVLREAHDRECAPRIDPRLDQPSIALYLLRTYVLRWSRPKLEGLAIAEQTSTPAELDPREARRAAAESAAATDAVAP